MMATETVDVMVSQLGLHSSAGDAEAFSGQATGHASSSADFDETRDDSLTKDRKLLLDQCEHTSDSMSNGVSAATESDPVQRGKSPSSVPGCERMSDTVVPKASCLKESTKDDLGLAAVKLQDSRSNGSHQDELLRSPQHQTGEPMSPASSDADAPGSDYEDGDLESTFIHAGDSVDHSADSAPRSVEMEPQPCEAKPMLPGKLSLPSSVSSLSPSDLGMDPESAGDHSAMTTSKAIADEQSETKTVRAVPISSAECNGAQSSAEDVATTAVPAVLIHASAEGVEQPSQPDVEARPEVEEHGTPIESLTMNGNATSSITDGPKAGEDLTTDGTVKHGEATVIVLPSRAPRPISEPIGAAKPALTSTVAGPSIQVAVGTTEQAKAVPKKPVRARCSSKATRKKTEMVTEKLAEPPGVIESAATSNVVQTPAESATGSRPAKKQSSARRAAKRKAEAMTDSQGEATTSAAIKRSASGGKAASDAQPQPKAKLSAQSSGSAQAPSKVPSRKRSRAKAKGRAEEEPTTCAFNVQEQTAAGLDHMPSQHVQAGHGQEINLQDAQHADQPYSSASAVASASFLRPPPPPPPLFMGSSGGGGKTEVKMAARSLDQSGAMPRSPGPSSTRSVNSDDADVRLRRSSEARWPDYPTQPPSMLDGYPSTAESVGRRHPYTPSDASEMSPEAAFCSVPRQSPNAPPGWQFPRFDLIDPAHLLTTLRDRTVWTFWDCYAPVGSRDQDIVIFSRDGVAFPCAAWNPSIFSPVLKSVMKNPGAKVKAILSRSVEDNRREFGHVPIPCILVDEDWQSTNFLLSFLHPIPSLFLPDRDIATKILAIGERYEVSRAVAVARSRLGELDAAAAAAAAAPRDTLPQQSADAVEA
ncbi:hypothetical protein BCV70DRAFT_217763 [Testicularia cyperi]|uniref:Uncharacterized protein n=1 Tax=Testicularia cyperi TaxID=1882483 RepID=A0A317XNG1_9BASI|nr:hypothetical protein BCV70DRAFT_217763 [Testicularia cyperi]